MCVCVCVYIYIYIYKPPITVHNSIASCVIWVPRLTLLNLQTRLLEQISFICSGLTLSIYILRVTEWQHSKGHKEYLKQTLILYIRQLRSRNKKQFIKSHTDKARLRVEPTSPVA